VSTSSGVSFMAIMSEMLTRGFGQCAMDANGLGGMENVGKLGKHGMLTGEV
jgi:hypothetical protein